MCFHIDKEKHPKVKIAKQDIICYKRLVSNNGRLTGVYFDYNYVLGALNYQPLYKMEIAAGKIHFGFHSYSNKKKVHEFYTSYICIIPKGSEYFYNSRYQEYVSNQIIIKEEL